MSSMFFEAERQKFFRPVSSSRRELVVACLRTLFDRLHGPSRWSMPPVAKGVRNVSVCPADVLFITLLPGRSVVKFGCALSSGCLASMLSSLQCIFGVTWISPE